MRYGILSSSIQVGGTSNITFRSVAQSYSGTGGTTLTINKPSGTVEGDLMVAIVDINGNITFSAEPSGWTRKQLDTVSTLGTFAIYYKVAGASEGSSYSWTWTGTQRYGGAIATFSGSFAADPQEGAFNFQEDNTSAIVTSITTTNDNAMVIYLSGYDQAAGGTWSQATSTFTNATANDASVNVYIGYKLFPTAGATGSADYSVSGGASAGADKASYLWAFIQNI